MAHKTMIGGTDYEITGGRTLIGGTGYEVAGGKTLIGGTGYDIEFGPRVIPVTITKGFSSTGGAYVSWPGTKTAAVGDYEMTEGQYFTAWVKVSGKVEYSKIYLNDTVVKQAAGSNAEFRFVPDCKAITVEITGDILNGIYYVRIYTH